jgi:GT2 family glycosyltransferase
VAPRVADVPLRSPGPHVAAVVLAHNGRDDTLRCLASLADARWAALTVIVVDNASRDGTAEAVHARYPEVHRLGQDENYGFAEGSNIGIRHALEAGAEYVLLLNNDTTIDPDAIAECVKVGQLHGDAGAICPIIYFLQPPTTIWYAGATFNPHRANSGRMIGYREVDGGQLSSTRQTDRVSGAAVLIPSAVLGRVGLLDARLFFLYEDVDWSLRVRRAGYRIYVTPEAKVWHRVSASAGGEHSALIAYYDTRNHVVVCERHGPLRGLAACRRRLGILAVHLAGARRAQRRLAYIGAVLAGWRDARRGRLGPRRASSPAR